MNKTHQITKRLSVIRYFLKSCMIILTGLLFGCSDPVSSYLEIKREPKIDPDYSGITIPPNIAPLNFTINENGEKYYVKMNTLNGKGIAVKSTDNIIKISSLKWKKLLEQCKGEDFSIDIFIKQEGSWKKFQKIINHVANDPIDKILVYRLFDQGFQIWNKMGIYQRCLENFNETPIIINSISEGNCINCHSFNKNNSNTILFHMRQKLPGTIIYRNGIVTKVNTKTSETTSPGVYPAWHPDGRHVTFSVNQILQVFLAVPDQMREAVDTISDLIVYDAQTNIIGKYPEIALKDRLETFPAWSPDGRFLYYCSAKTLPPGEFKKFKYDLLRIAFNPETNQFGKVDTIVSSARTGMSVSLPRISPDGKYVLFSMSSYGTFLLWHEDSDLYLMNLETGKITKPDINSNLPESYHSWSSSGRWIVFSSKRSDGFTTQPYFTYFDAKGQAHKPFVLPQRNPEFYKTFLRSYNVPELVTSKVKLSPRNLREIINYEPADAHLGSMK